MTIGEAIHRVHSLYSKGVRANTSTLTSRHIYNKLLSTRAKLLTQKANKKQKISQWNFQTIPCVDLEKVPIHECPCVPIIGCKILKSKHKIPKPITDLNSPLIQSVTSLDGSIVFSEISWLQKKYKSGNKYTKNKPDYFIKDNYLYITTGDSTKIVQITGLFEDPVEVEKYPNSCNTVYDECESPFDKVFPVDTNLMDTLIEMSLSELLSVFSQGGIKVPPPVEEQQRR